MNNLDETLDKNGYFANNGENENKSEQTVTTNTENKSEQNTTTTSTENKSEQNTTTTSTENKSEQNTTTTSAENKSELSLTHLNKDFVYELMKVPTHSGSEYRMLTFIILWARRNNIKYEFDTYGNLYLTKGTINEGEYYPCVTAHLDSVQTKHKLYAQAGQDLEVKTRIVSNKHEIYVDGMGIGGDDKAGVLIGLSMFSHVDKLKACFFLEEETSCKGSNKLKVEWFDNVGYVLGYDSPDLNRAAWSCSGTKLFNADFFKTHMQEICKKHGLTDFRAEPFTDVKIIREKTNIICMNFGSGYYNAHTPNEYCIIEDMDTACRMGHDLINHLGLKRYELEHTDSTTWINGTRYTAKDDKDEDFFNSLRPKTQYNYGGYNGYGGYNYNSGYYNQSNTSSSKSKTNNDDDDEKVKIETVKYISDKYELYIKTLKDNIEAKCKELSVDFTNFAELFKNEIKF